MGNSIKKTSAGMSSKVTKRRTRSGYLPRAATRRGPRIVEPVPEPEVPEQVIDLCTTIEDEASCIDLTADVEEEIVDLTAVNDSPILVLGPGTSNQRRSRAPKRVRNDAEELPDLHDVGKSPKMDSKGSSVSILDSDSKRDSKRDSCPVKKIVCPVCLDELKAIQNSNRQLVSTICGHLFCNLCIQEAIRAQHLCPTCRKKLTLKQFHPIFL